MIICLLVPNRFQQINKLIQIDKMLLHRLALARFRTLPLADEVPGVIDMWFPLPDFTTECLRNDARHSKVVLFCQLY